MRIILTILFFCTLQVQAAVYYVKASGGTGSGLNDANAWSFAKYKSMEGSLGGNVVLFNRGDQFYGTLNPPSNLVINSYGFGAQPIITGFTSVTSWTNVGTNLWEASVSAGAQLNMLTVNGAIVEPGRYPNSGWLNITAGGDSSLTTDASGISTYAGGDAVIRKREWVIDRCQIKTISGQTITYSNPVPELYTQYAHFPALSPPFANGYWGFYFTDHPATLDLQNEWYYNNGTLRMYSTVNPSTLNVKAATIPTLVTLGSASNVSFSTVDFQGCNGTGIYTDDAGTGNTFSNCGISFIGKNGFATRFQNNFTIQNCNINNTLWSGITIIQGSNQYVLNNTITNIGMWNSLCQPNNKANHGIWVNGNFNRIAGNTISYTGYVGIDFGGDYDTCINNYIHHYNQKSTDGGGIYMSDETNGIGRVIENNVTVFGLGMRDGSPIPGYDMAMGIYLDESTAGVTVRKNFSAFNAGGGAYLHMAHDVSFSENIFYDNSFCQVKFAEDNAFSTRMKNIVFTKNVSHSTNSTDYVYVFYCVDSTANFFSYCANNIISRPSNQSNSIYEVINYFNGPDVARSLAQWQMRYPNFETFSSQAPASFNSGPIKIETTYNGTYFVPLDGVYQAFDGTLYKAGTYVLPSFSGTILSRTGDFVPVVTKPVTIRGRIR